MLRRLKTRHKNPQLVALHCFVASFGPMFRVFHLAWSTCHATKTFVAGWRNATRWLVDLFGGDPRQVASLVKNQQRSQNFTLLFSTAFFNRQQKYLLRDELITQGDKNAKHGPKTCDETSWGSLNFVFPRLQIGSFRNHDGGANLPGNHLGEVVAHCQNYLETEYSVKIKIRIWKKSSCRLSRSPATQNFTLLFCRGQQKNYKLNHMHNSLNLPVPAVVVVFVNSLISQG